MQLLVLGMHRSGTSMLTRLINLMGAYVGPEHEMQSSDDANPKGYWERNDVMAVNDAILHLHGCTWGRVADWSSAQPHALPPKLLHRLRYIVLGMDGFRPWVMKDPRLCLTLPCWTPFLEEPVAVLMHRDPLQIARSLEQRSIPPPFTPALGLSLWEYHAVGALNASLGMPRVFVSHDRLIAHPVEAVSRLFSDLEALGMGMRRLSMPSEREITAFVDPRLNRVKGDVSAAATLLTPSQQEIDAMLRGERIEHAVLDVSAASVEAMAQVKADEAMAQAKADEAMAQEKGIQKFHSPKAYLVSRIAKILSLKNSKSRNL